MLNKMKLFLVAFACLVSYPSFASIFDLMDDASEGYYGNAKSPAFERAIEGSEVLTPAEQDFLDNVEQTRITERWHTRLLIGRPKVKLPAPSDTISGESLSASADANKTTQLLLAAGYLWQHWGLEAEVLWSNTLHYQGNFPSINEATVLADIKQYGLLFNVQYVIPHWFSFYPKYLQLHLDAGAGAAYKSVKTTLEQDPFSSNDSTSTIALAAQLGGGARYQIVPSLLVDVAYRYISLGKTKFKTPELSLKSSNSTSHGLFVGLTYQF